MPLVVTTALGTAVAARYFDVRVWKPARETAGIPHTREHGMHACRHYYASVLLDAGESIKAVSEYLGHHDPGFTLRTYTHLMPTSEDRTKKAIAGALGATVTALISGESAPVVPSEASAT